MSTSKIIVRIGPYL